MASHPLNRRQLMGGALLLALQAACRQSAAAPEDAAEPAAGASAGGLVDTGAGLLALAPGFRYVILQRAGQPMAEDQIVPPQPDGMEAFEHQGDWVLLRNHELGQNGRWWRGAPPPTSFSAGSTGGVTRVLLDPARLRAELGLMGDAPLPDGADSAAVRSTVPVLCGTRVNCAGGRMPEGWVSCEETDDAGHGWAFLTRPEHDTPQQAECLTSWGRFSREAIAWDAERGAVYMTEDTGRGAPLYRFVPEDPAQPYGPGRVEALVCEGLGQGWPGDEDGPAQGDSWATRWVPVPDPSAARQPCRDQVGYHPEHRPEGATRFAKCEGVAIDERGVWFIASTEGPAGAGQLFRYDPTTERCHLAFQVTDRSILSMPDNIIFTPHGGLLMAEDNYSSDARCTAQHLRLLRPDGRILELARNRNATPRQPGRAPGAEFAGPCFSPDGQILFVNLQSPENVTVAIAGDWAAWEGRA